MKKFIISMLAMIMALGLLINFTLSPTMPEQYELCYCYDHEPVEQLLDETEAFQRFLQSGSLSDLLAIGDSVVIHWFDEPVLVVCDDPEILQRNMQRYLESLNEKRCRVCS